MAIGIARTALKKRYFNIIVSAFAGLALVIGKLIYNENILFPISSGRLMCLFKIIIYSATCFAFLELISVIHIHNAKINNLSNTILRNKYISRLMGSKILLTVIILLFWIPAWLTYYPGIFSYDVYSEINWPLTKFHPVIHVLFIRLCMLVGRSYRILGDNTPIVIYSIIQMFILALSFSYMLKFLYVKKCNFFIVFLAFAFIAFNPAIAVFSFVPTKDVLCGAFFIIFIINIYDILVDKCVRYTNILFCIVSGTLATLFRNNMIYAVVVATFITIIKREYRYKRLLLCLIIVILLHIFVNNFLFTTVMGIPNGDKREMLSVPMQQIAYVYSVHYEELSGDEISKIESYFDGNINELYNPRVSDPIKFVFNTDIYISDSARFWKLYFDLGKKHFYEYSLAALNLNIPYWYPLANTYDSYSRRPYIEDGLQKVDEELEFSRTHWFPNLESFFADFSVYSIQSKSIFLNIIFGISFPIWIMLIAYGKNIYLDRKKSNIMILFPFVYWCTFLLGPVSNMRYMLPIYFLYPLFMVSIFSSGNSY